MSGEPIRVMVVDDDRDVCQTLAEALSAEGCQACACFDGAAAQRAFAQFDPHCVMIDVRLPGIDGLELSRWVRLQSSDAVVIAMSGADRSDERVAAAFDLADHWFEKPVDTAAFRRMLQL